VPPPNQLPADPVYPTKLNVEMADTFEAFFVVESDGPLGPTSYRAGYRCGEAGNVVCALDLPASIVEATILRDAKLAVTIAPDGDIRSSVCRIACDDMGHGLPSVTVPIDQLIAEFVAVDSLRLEEVSSADLSSLLQRLQRSVSIVQEAMKHLAGQQIPNPHDLSSQSS